MKISFQNLGIYSTNNLSRQKSFGCSNCDKTMGIADKLPNTALYADLSNFDVHYTKRQALEEDYKNKVFNLCFDENGKVDERIKSYLDNAKFDIETASKEKKQMTIKEAVQSSILRTYDIDMNLYHATFTKEVGQQIIENGFDPKKISRTQFGPGFYFSSSEGAAREYNSAVLKADCKGKCMHVDGPYFDRITESNVYKCLTDFIGLKNDNWALASINQDISRKVLYEYTRNMIVDELCFDMAYGSHRFDSCFAIYNPESISNITMQN